MAVKRKSKVPNGITFKMVMIIVISMAIVLILGMIKIYLSNQIYYESREVNRLQQHVSVLKVEKQLLEQKVEALKFKNRVTDTIFVIKEDE
jgi:cell division protein FtsL